jgi:hypothetical protein
MNLISRLKDLVVYLIGFVVRTQFLNSRLSMMIDMAYDHKVMHKWKQMLGNGFSK